MKRIICGIGSDGRNTVLQQGAPAPLMIETAPDNPEAGAELYLAWASQKLGKQTEDLISDIQVPDLKLAPGETRFLRIVLPPGTESSMHRTPHIVDYLVGLSGTLTLELEDGSTTLIEPGDMVVQLSGFHGWRNEGTEPFVMAALVLGIEADEEAPPGGVVLKAQ